MTALKLHPLDDWVLHLGKLLSAFQSLEFVLRGFLYERTAEPEQRPPHGEDLYAHQVGSLVLLNPMTDYRSLKQLIVAYNSSLPPDRNDWAVEPGVADTRDAIAHGRVTAPEVGEKMRLIKFSPPIAKQPTHVRVTVNLTVDLAWLKSQIDYVQTQTLKVVDAHRTLHSSPAV
ncbi:MAG: hypothetical protein A2Z21_08680 [Candidatus Fraserbacteria bacterium RBG_16_55_9]|uniref:Uncharacterized protein n=1 Tax=Fraserbacteria sp. (strain RBG_16_55_9) TaxID=1817864 RepID=A0A1F5V099_FRAXR|nr:MAG: hypothetical protein A2Z21_08680 [Candidatus Fraserbacteria bacterium RBG_16_55_9]